VQDLSSATSLVLLHWSMYLRGHEPINPLALACLTLGEYLAFDEQKQQIIGERSAFVCVFLCGKHPGIWIHAS
jgi:hypothetical protein